MLGFVRFGFTLRVGSGLARDSSILVLAKDVLR
jgi:hypothetical protein